MPTEWTAIDKYLIRSYGRKSGVHETGTQCCIICYKDSVLTGYINFYKEGFIPGPNILTSTGVGVTKKILRINFHEKRIEEIISILRNEEPVYIGVNLGFGMGYVGTSTEPIGEEEGQGED